MTDSPGSRAGQHSIATFPKSTFGLVAAARAWGVRPEVAPQEVPGLPEKQLRVRLARFEIAETMPDGRRDGLARLSPGGRLQFLEQRLVFDPPPSIRATLDELALNPTKVSRVVCVIERRIGPLGGSLAQRVDIPGGIVAPTIFSARSNSSLMRVGMRGLRKQLRRKAIGGGPVRMELALLHDHPQGDTN